MIRKVSNQGIDLIKKFEGLRTTSYIDSAGVWTIGYGHTLTAKPSMTISTQEADSLLRKDLVTAEAGVMRALTTKPYAELSQAQIDALVSFTFNVGAGAFHTSTMARLINSNAPALDVANEFARWKFAGGRVLPGLVMRRGLESQLYLSKVVDPLQALTWAVIAYLVATTMAGKD